MHSAASAPFTQDPIAIPQPKHQEVSCRPVVPCARPVEVIHFDLLPAYRQRLPVSLNVGQFWRFDSPITHSRYRGLVILP